MATNDESEMMVGPGAIADVGVAPKPLLEGSSQYEWVELLNPMSRPFGGTFGMSRPTSASPINITPIQGRGVTNNENDLRNNYGLDLRNPDHQGRADIVNRVTILPGKTVILLGNEAQVIIRQLVNAIMQLEGRSLLLADPHARKEVEERVIVGRGNAAERLGRNPESVNQQLQAVKIEETTIEEAFPTVDAGSPEDPGTTDPSGIGAGTQPRVERKSPQAKGTRG